MFPLSDYRHFLDSSSSVYTLPPDDEICFPFEMADHEDDKDNKDTSVFQPSPKLSLKSPNSNQFVTDDKKYLFDSASQNSSVIRMSKF